MIWNIRSTLLRAGYVYKIYHLKCLEIAIVTIVGMHIYGQYYLLFTGLKKLPLWKRLSNRTHTMPKVRAYVWSKCKKIKKAKKRRLLQYSFTYIFIYHWNTWSNWTKTTSRMERTRYIRIRYILLHFVFSALELGSCFNTDLTNWIIKL